MTAYGIGPVLAESHLEDSPPGIEPGVTDHLIRVSDDGIQGVQGGMATCSVILRASQW